MAAQAAICQWPVFSGQHFQETQGIAHTRDSNAIDLFSSLSWTCIPSKSKTQKAKLCSSPMPKKGGIHVFSSNTLSPSMPAELLDAWDDDYNGIVIDSASLPSSANAFAAALRASLSNWKAKGKKGIWLKLFHEQSDLVPIAIQEGFDYHHAEPGYMMLTYWIPDEPCMLPTSPSHQIGIAGFVINDNREILVVKEKSSCSCVGVWKLPTGYINKSEEIFSGATREVKEETGVDTMFLEMVAFRHVHRVAFEKSDLLFACMLKPLSSEITIDEKEIQDAKRTRCQERSSRYAWQLMKIATGVLQHISSSPNLMENCLSCTSITRT
ncbi:nudix hydrolase 8 isoform X2 [Coffea arabica]|uniref:Nudix hydrolase 8 isoform X2 n=1 Tax=Coffea arabica TaxID=13443 RepID=A0ABM4UUV7_COFAR